MGRIHCCRLLKPTRINPLANRGRAIHSVHTGRIYGGETVFYRARVYDCGPCPLKPTCCPKAPERKIPRSIYQDARDPRVYSPTPKRSRNHAMIANASRLCSLIANAS